MYNLIEELIELPLHPKNTAENFRINFADEIQAGLTIIKNGEFCWKAPGAPAPQPKPEEKKEEIKKIEKDVIRLDIEHHKDEKKY